jgi:hypothetical protein
MIDRNSKTKGMVEISYREQFVKNIKDLFKKEAAAYLRKEKAEELISYYFNELMEELYDESEAAAEKFEIDYDRIKLQGIELSFEFVPHAIKVFITSESSGGKTLIDRLEDDGSNFVSSKLNKELSEELMNEYLKQAYSETLNLTLTT